MKLYPFFFLLIISAHALADDVLYSPTYGDDYKLKGLSFWKLGTAIQENPFGEAGVLETGPDSCFDFNTITETLETPTLRFHVFSARDSRWTPNSLSIDFVIEKVLNTVKAESFRLSKLGTKLLEKIGHEEFLNRCGPMTVVAWNQGQYVGAHISVSVSPEEVLVESSETFPGTLEGLSAALTSLKALQARYAHIDGTGVFTNVDSLFQPDCRITNEDCAKTAFERMQSDLGKNQGMLDFWLRPTSEILPN